MWNGWAEPGLIHDVLHATWCSATIILLAELIPEQSFALLLGCARPFLSLGACQRSILAPKVCLDPVSSVHIDLVFSDHVLSALAPWPVLVQGYVHQKGEAAHK